MNAPEFGEVEMFGWNPLHVGDKHGLSQTDPYPFFEMIRHYSGTVRNCGSKQKQKQNLDDSYLVKLLFCFY